MTIKNYIFTGEILPISGWIGGIDSVALTETVPLRCSLKACFKMKEIWILENILKHYPLAARLRGLYFVAVH